MLFKDAQLAGIRDGSITVSFRYWEQPRVRRLKPLGLTLSPGTGYRLSPLGMSYVVATPSRKNPP